MSMHHFVHMKKIPPVAFLSIFSEANIGIPQAICQELAGLCRVREQREERMQRSEMALCEVWFVRLRCSGGGGDGNVRGRDEIGDGSNIRLGLKEAGLIKGRSVGF
ncbi:hypothetical protein L2E82_11151 [Cichorium intybus]|uniref:Uncharacterized protein n=1 Tax=Cichorium intybus TaxID=13427 RepID=A0ACB9GC19_CICIN|nr:hypothetical protein L2E82_11151 [Cichorium intybus]